MQARPRSLRARSTIITFSAWSFALACSASAATAPPGPVPLIGRVTTRSPTRRRNASGDADTTANAPGTDVAAPAGSRSMPAWGAGFHAASAAWRATGSSVPWASSRRVRLTW